MKIKFFVFASALALASLITADAKKWTKQGGGVGWVRPTRLDLTTLKETSAGKIACVYIE